MQSITSKYVGLKQSKTEGFVIPHEQAFKSNSQIVILR